jgi:hypothetical protein
MCLCGRLLLLMSSQVSVSHHPLEMCSTHLRMWLFACKSLLPSLIQEFGSSYVGPPLWCIDPSGSISPHCGGRVPAMIVAGCGAKTDAALSRQASPVGLCLALFNATQLMPRHGTMCLCPPPCQQVAGTLLPTMGRD